MHKNRYMACKKMANENLYLDGQNLDTLPTILIPHLHLLTKSYYLYSSLELTMHNI